MLQLQVLISALGLVFLFSKAACHVLQQAKRGPVLLPPSAPAPPLGTFQYCPDKPPYVRFATFGDSYASGVTYGSALGHPKGRPDRDYDYGDPGLIRRCRRLVGAYAYQMKNDCTWTDGFPPYLDWPACSGSLIDAIKGQAKDLFEAQHAASPNNVSNFATVQIGGNNAGFFDIAVNCFFQPDPDCRHDYGGTYPDQDGECWKAIRKAQDFVRGKPFRAAFTGMLDAVLNHKVVSTKADFRLFVLGYAQFFQVDNKSTGDACDQISWTAACAKRTVDGRKDRYHVTSLLRQDVNSLILYLNHQISDFVSEYAKKDSRVLYVDIDSAFDGHRFCQTPDGGKVKSGWEKSWFWRGPLLSDFVTEGSPTSADFEWTTSSELDPETVSNCDSLTSNTLVTAPWDVQLSCVLKAGGQPVADSPISPQYFSSGPGGGGLADRGEVLRTFHPTADGHESIHKLLVAAVEEEQKKSSFLHPT